MTFLNTLLSSRSQDINIQSYPQTSVDLRYRIMGCASSSNTEIIQRYQAKMLRLITQAPWYVTIQTPDRDLRINPVREIFKEKAEAHRKTLSTHPKLTYGTPDNSIINPEAETQMDI